MIPDGEYTAVVDRFEDGQAVILVENDGETVGDVAVDKSTLPADARHQDAVLVVSITDGELADATYDPDETERRSEDAQRRFDRLARRPDGESGADQSEANEGEGEGRDDGNEAGETESEDEDEWY